MTTLRPSSSRSLRLRPYAALTLALLGCSSAAPGDDAAPSSPVGAPHLSMGAPARLFRASGSDGAPSQIGWVTGTVPSSNGATLEARSIDAVRALAEDLAVEPAGLAAARVTSVLGRPGGSAVVRVGQTVDGVDLLHARLNLLFDPAGRLVATGGRLAPTVSKPAPARLDARAAVAIAATESGVPLAAGDVADLRAKRGLFDDFSGPGLASPARVRRVLVDGARDLEPAFQIEIFARVGREDVARRLVVSATTGAVLSSASLVAHAPVSYRVWADPTGNHRPADGPTADFTPHPTGQPDATVPPFVAPSLVSIDGFNVNQDPWLAPGATTTKGNNVDAYTDDDSPDGFSAGDLRGASTMLGSFDHTYDPNLDPQANDTQRQASAVAGFYVANWLHDDWYDAGFDEVAGNAQQSNLGRGGAGNDPLLVEVQDGAPDSLNNANAATPSDGQSPRLQFYVWSGITSASLDFAGQPLSVGVAAFGPTAFDVTGTVVLVNDGAGTATDGCEPPTNNVAGQILLVDRGMCAFKQKVLNAEAAGAIGVIVANQMAGGAPFMPDGPPNTPVAIGALSVSQSDGAVLKQALVNGPTTVKLSRTTTALRDGALDHLVMAHEWGHYLHHRLTACELSQCGAESEGWGDFVALHLMLREGDNLAGVFADAVYAPGGLSSAGAYFGTRRYPYSTDFTKNALTFKHIQADEPLPAGVPVEPGAITFNNESHAAGEVWASMVFEAYVALLQNASGPGAPYTFDEARARMAKYVVQGMSLAPAEPTYTEQRDGILAAALASDPADALLLAQGFAKRGAGSCAVSPPRTSSDFLGVVESFVVAPSVQIAELGVYPNVSCDTDAYLDDGEQGEVRVVVRNAGLVELTGATLTITSPDPALLFAGGGTVAIDPIPALGAATVSVPVSRVGAPASTVDDLKATVSAPTACAPMVERAGVFPMASDEAPSTADTVEAIATTWELAGNDAELTWSREAEQGNHVWHGVDVAGESSRALVSPSITVGTGQPFVVSFEHAYDFEESMNTFWDGGVVEISISKGAWKDASEFVTIAYDGPLSTDANNPLGGRDAFSGISDGYPARKLVTLDFGEQFAGQTLQIRFRIGTDAAVSRDGWFIDDITVQGATNQPFIGLVDDACAPPSETTSNAGSTGASMSTGGAGGGFVDGLHLAGGCGCVVASDDGPTGVLGALGAAGAAAAWLRRRAARRAQRNST